MPNQSNPSRECEYAFWIVISLFIAFGLSGCGGSRSPVFTTNTTQAAVNPTPIDPDAPPGPAPNPQPQTGDLAVQLQLLNARAVKTDARTFRITLSQNEVLVLSRSFVRESVGANQTLSVERLAPGKYFFELTYLSASGTVLGIFQQTITIVANQTTTITDPDYRNEILDFTSSRSFKVESRPSFATIADVNGDSFPDLISANRDTDNLSVLLGNGDGTFRASANFGAGDQPRSVAAADVNGDNLPDLVSANEFSNNLSVLLNNGDGTFQAAINFGVGVRPRSVAVADVNGDTFPDRTLTAPACRCF